MVLKEHTRLYTTAPMKRQRQPRQRHWALHEREASQAPAARLDLSKLKVHSLRKYISTFELDVSPSSSKEAMLAAVHKHWQSQVVRENEVMHNLAVAFRKQASHGQH